MRVVRKEDISNPVKNPSGEEIYEMIGRLPKPLEPHQIYNEGEDDLEFLTVSAPAWTADDSFFTPEETHI